jgi:hypothetical protein
MNLIIDTSKGKAPIAINGSQVIINKFVVNSGYDINAAARLLFDLDSLSLVTGNLN